VSLRVEAGAVEWDAGAAVVARASGAVSSQAGAVVRTRDVEYEADGRLLVGRLAVPDGDDRRPGIVIAHEGLGLDDFQKDRASRFAELGYVAFALDYHGGGKPLADREAMRARLDELAEDPKRMRALGRAGLDVLSGEPRTDVSKLAGVGYCFGGAMVLELARAGVGLKAVIGFHPGLRTARSQDAANIVGKVLVCVGSEDSFVPLEQRVAFEDEMRAADVDWTMNLYGGVEHSFTHRQAHLAGVPGIRYDERTDQRSWRAMLNLLDEAFA
jgi:dienelactone hydrolase